MLPLLLSTALSAPVTAEITVDATTPGTLHITMEWRGLPPGDLKLSSAAHAPEYTIEYLAIHTPSGWVEPEHSGSSYLLPGDHEPTVTLRYQVTPGGVGRHGHQGYAAEDWLVVDGRIFVWPRGGVDAASVGLRFVLPDGWIEAVPWTRVGEGYKLGALGAATVDQRLMATCFGLGRYARFDAEIGGQPLSLFTYADWPDAHVRALEQGTEAMVRWFHDTEGFQAPYSVVFTPKPTEHRVFGGSHGEGTCYENPPRSDGPRPRNWQLLGHRIGHAMNKYPPTGMVIRDPQDHWFMEGWASYVEVQSTAGAGVIADTSFFDTLYRRHLRYLRTHPDTHFVLRDEPDVPASQTDYLHYTASPLVVRTLDVWMQRRSGVSMDAFFRSLYQTYGHFQGAVPLREAVEQFTGDSYADFWALAVDAPMIVLPAWRAQPTEAERRRAAARPAAMASGMAVSPQLLRTMAASGDFLRYADMVSFLQAAGVRLADLRRRGVFLLPEALLDVHSGLDGRTDYDLLRSALQYPLALAPAPARLGCGEAPLPMPSFTPDGQHPVGLLFAELLADERTYEAALARSGVTAVQARPTKESLPVLAYPEHRSILIMAGWARPPRDFTLSVEQRGSEGHTKSLTLEPTWTRTWSTFRAADRPDGEGVQRFVYRHDDGTLIQRSFWQLLQSPP